MFTVWAIMQEIYNVSQSLLDLTLYALQVSVLELTVGKFQLFLLIIIFYFSMFSIGPKLRTPNILEKVVHLPLIFK